MRCSIYIVDDDDAARASAQILLSMRFPQSIVRVFPSGDAFLQELDELDPAVLLVDLHMPGATGFEVLSAVARHDGKFVPIMLTGQGSISIAVQAMRSNAFDFLEKPYDPAKLISAVEIAMSRFEHNRAILTRKRAARDNLEKLTARETDVLKGLIDGRQNKQIAQELSLSPRTVEIYRASLMDKLEVRTLSEALRMAFTAGLFPET